MKNILFLLITFTTTILASQNISKKSVIATRINEKPVIDGVLDESFWLGTDTAKDFVMFKPGDGEKEKERKTIVKFAYDDTAIYIGAIMYDPDTKTIPTQLTSRDNIGNTDFFLISLNPNNDGQNDTEFAVTSAGTQADAKVTSNGEDWSWSAVWESDIKINEDSWVVEMKIPYAALRFSNTKMSSWGVNIHRRIQSTNEQFVWNYIDKSSSLLTQFAGEIKGISKINPPTRLSFSPYASTIYNSYDGDTNFDYNYGVDVKYGISDSFTLDATLIPDFGQTAFDDVTLNLGPFEQQYSEKRSFFTEGTELFNKGRLFYSRRIGNTPTAYSNIEDNLADNEEIINNPTKVDMINAVKISGRTKGNLGIGVFNAITKKTSAKIKDKTSGEIRKEITEPFTNYNVIVLDQQFRKTSSVTFVNTNVTRAGHFRDANVTGLLFNILNKKNTHFIDGSLKLSNIIENGKTSTGFFGDFSLGKSSGNHQYEVGLNSVNSRYDINDLGFNQRTNYKRYYSRYSYRIFEPVGIFNNYGLNIWGNINYLNKPNTYTSSNVGFNFWGNTKTQKNIGINMNFNLGKSKDFYEPRTEDFSIYYKQKSSGNLNTWFSSDFRKKFAIEASFGAYIRFITNENSYWFAFSPRYRFSDKFQIAYEFEYDTSNNDKGWVDTLDDNSIIFGNRTSKTIVNSVSSSLNFNTKSSLSLAFRYYWSPVNYDENYFMLDTNGDLNNSNYTKNHDINYNIWNFDLSYTWEFAPGSQLIALYRNSLFNEDNLSHLKFNKNLDNLFNNPMDHNFSIKLIYYLDYNKLKNTF